VPGDRSASSDAPAPAKRDFVTSMPAPSMSAAAPEMPELPAAVLLLEHLGRKRVGG
jgi:hypothetical protein